MVFLVSLIGSVSALTYCCEKTGGNPSVWCQETDSETQCLTTTNPVNDQPFRASQTSCDATDYCQPGTCIDGDMGICMPNVPRMVCEKEHGTWSSDAPEGIPQCQTGCCLIGEQAAFVPKAVCDNMGKRYVLQTRFVASITDEAECLKNANPHAKGACVYTVDLARTCRFGTKEECTAIQKNYQDAYFREGLLCSAPELMACTATTPVQTACDSNDNVRFVDSCHNLANIYDFSKINDKDYWTYIRDPTCTTSDNPGNKNSATCGACNYGSGSMCKQKERGQTVSAGNFICKDLDCTTYTQLGNNYKAADGSYLYPHHGETWCATSSKTSSPDSPGASDFRMMCYNGEVTSEECDPLRQKVCLQASDNATKYLYANCRVNRWQDCISQNNSADCNDKNTRDCIWFESGSDANPGKFYFSSTGLKSSAIEKDPDAPKGVCVPLYSPGFGRTSDPKVYGGETTCKAASAICNVRVPSTGSSCNKDDANANCSCLDPSWQKNLNAICMQLGDCGSQTNYIGESGYSFSNIITVQNTQTE